jgi:hypothetical protein
VYVHVLAQRLAQPHHAWNDPHRLLSKVPDLVRAIGAAALVGGRLRTPAVAVQPEQRTELQQNGLFLSAFPYVCPEPVLVK